MTRRRAGRGVFLNVPFDRQYGRLSDALVFAVHDCGLIARCALETDDGSQIRFDKICAIIAECELGIHDLSRTTLDGVNRLPRFNMPLELGLFLGAKRFGGSRHRWKSALILERRPFRYQVYCSDLAGQDIRAHHNSTVSAVVAVRNWLQTVWRTNLWSGRTIGIRYMTFRNQLPRVCADQGLDERTLTFIDYREQVEDWIYRNP